MTTNINPYQNLAQQARNAAQEYAAQQANQLSGHPGILGGASVKRPSQWHEGQRLVFFEVVAVANGYLLKHSIYEGGTMTTHIAADMDELRDLFTSVLVAQKLEKANV